jgi:hypothetical protein
VPQARLQLYELDKSPSPVHISYISKTRDGKERKTIDLRRLPEARVSGACPHVMGDGVVGVGDPEGSRIVVRVVRLPYVRGDQVYNRSLENAQVASKVIPGLDPAGEREN